jgi:hypothetical protein
MSRAVEQRRLDAEGDRARADVGCRRRDRLLHHVAQLAGGDHRALAGHRHGLDGQDLAADFRPGKTGDHADLIGPDRLRRSDTSSTPA